MVETNFVSPVFEEPIDTQIRDHRVAVRQRSKASFHTSFFDAIFTRIMAYDLIENKLFSIKMKRKNFTMNWSDFDNSEVKHDDIMNSDPEKIKEEIIDKSGFDGDDKIYKEPCRISYFLYNFKYCRSVFHFEPMKRLFGYIKKPFDTRNQKNQL